MPLSVLDQQVFLGGVLTDPDTITYSLKDPSAVAGLDEDAAAVTARVPIRTGVGHYHAGNTILIDDTKLGIWEIEWTITKLPAGTPIIKKFPFSLAKVVIEDATRESVSRRDTPDTANIDALREMIGDNVPDDTSWAFFNSELQGFITKSVAIHTAALKTEGSSDAAEIAQALTLSHAKVMYKLATDKRVFFKWKDGNESVDKTMQMSNCVKLAQALIDEYETLERLKLDTKKETGFSSSPAGGLLEFRGGDRRRRR